MSFAGLQLVRHCINMRPVSSFMGDIVGVCLVTDHSGSVIECRDMDIQKNSFYGRL